MYTGATRESPLRPQERRFLLQNDTIFVQLIVVWNAMISTLSPFLACYQSADEGKSARFEIHLTDKQLRQADLAIKEAQKYR